MTRRRKKTVKRLVALARAETKAEASMELEALKLRLQSLGMAQHLYWHENQKTQVSLIVNESELRYARDKELLYNYIRSDLIGQLDRWALENGFISSNKKIV